MSNNTKNDLHTLLDSLTDGEHVKATWVYDKHTVVVEGPVSANDRGVWCDRFIRWTDGSINRSLASLEVTYDEEVTVTRDDEEALHALLDSLTDGQDVTAEWRNRRGAMITTGHVHASDGALEVRGYGVNVLHWHRTGLHRFLHSVTVRRTVVQRWERDDDE